MANNQPPILCRPAVLLFGDSLTERSLDPRGGWGAAVAHHFARKVDVINRGFGGYNSCWALPLLDQVLAQLAASNQSVLFATLWLGANDAAMPERGSKQQHVPLSVFTSNLDKMVAKMKAAHIARLVLITPPPVYDEGRVLHQQQRMGTSDPVDPDRTNAFTAQYAEAVRQLGGKHHLPVLDLHSELQKVEGWQTGLLMDGLHFTPEGQALVGQLLIGLLGSKFPELSLEKLPNHFLWWDKFVEAGSGKDEVVWNKFLQVQNVSRG